MIPYEELCAALARWRERHGLANGPSATPPPPLATPLAAENTTIGPPPIAAFAAAVTLETAPPDDGPTGLHLVAPERSGEVDLDSADVLDEEELP